MLKAQDIADRLHQAPFRPFRVHISDGKSFEVTHPDQVLVLQHKIVVGVGEGEAGGYERDVHCAMVHITRIEDMAPR